MVVFAGPNGSGKSSIANMYYRENVTIPPLYINADDITKDIAKEKNLDVKTISKEVLDEINTQAANQADRLRQDAINRKESFTTETLMSTSRRVDLLREAKINGFEIHTFFVTTQNPRINIERVEDRVKKGGHAVPPEKTKERYERVMRLLPEIIQASDTIDVFNNTFENPKIILSKTLNNEIEIYPQNPLNPNSKWTEEKLEEIKQNVLKIDERFKAIQQAPNVKTLSKNPHSKDLYHAYAKEVLAEDGQVWRSIATDKLIAKKMIKAGISPQRVKDSLSHSPNMVSLSIADKLSRINELIKGIDIPKKGLHI